MYLNRAEIKFSVTNLLKIWDHLGDLGAVVDRVPLKRVVFKQANCFFIECAPVVLEGVARELRVVRVKLILCVAVLICFES